MAEPDDYSLEDLSVDFVPLLEGIESCPMPWVEVAVPMCLSKYRLFIH